MFIGEHIILDMYGIENTELLKDEQAIQNILIRAAQEARSEVVTFHSHKFDVGEGISAIVIIAESHISIHTYPEHNIAMADVFTCGSHTLPKEAMKVLLEAFQPRHITIHHHSRGKIETDVNY